MKTLPIPLVGNSVLSEIFAKSKGSGGCLLWTGRKTRQGYGQIQIAKRLYYIHRVAWTIENGSIPEGDVIDHLCENPSCFLTDHLRAVPVRTNVLKGTGPTAINARKTRCINGHPLSGENIRVRNRQRICRTCARESKRRSRARLP